MPTPVIILVGGPNTNAKFEFYERFTACKITDKVHIHVVKNSIPQIVLINTPAYHENRDPLDYCWEGIFQIGDIIVNFGDWMPREIYGVKPPFSHLPFFLTWSGDHDETMTRIMDKVAEMV